MKKLRKRIIAFVVAACMVCAFSVPAFASNSSYVTGAAGGASTYGRTTIGSRSATGTTGCSSPATEAVTVTFTYGYGDGYYSVSNSNYTPNGYSTMITATAGESEIGNIVAQSGTSSHDVSCNGAHWFDTTVAWA